MVATPNRQKRLARAWLVAVGVLAVLGVIAAVALVVYRDRQQNNTTGPEPAAIEQQAQRQIEELREQFQAYSNGDLDFRNLVPEVDRYTQTYPDRPEGHILLGQVYMKLERWQPALDALAKALAIDPDYFQLQKLAGTCAAKLGRWEQAEDHLRQALAMQAERDVHLMLGNVYYQTQRYEQAEQQYNLAIQKAGATPPYKAYSGLADVRGKQGQYAEALQLVDEAIGWSGADAEVKPWTYPLQKVRLLMDAGRMDDAGQLLAVEIHDDPAASFTFDYVQLQARLWAHEGRVEAIPGLFAELAERLFLDPERDPAVLGDVLAELAHWRLELGRTDTAADALARLRTVRPNHPRLGELESRLNAQPKPTPPIE